MKRGVPRKVYQPDVIKKKRLKKGTADEQGQTHREYYDPTNVLEALLLMNRNTSELQVDQMF